jgi:hypothetical protein
MIRRTMVLTAVALALVAGFAPAASADFGFDSFDGATLESDGSSATQAGSHPFEATTEFQLHTITDAFGNAVPDGNMANLTVSLPPGFVGNPTALPKCTEAQLATFSFETDRTACPIGSQVGVVETAFTEGEEKPTVFLIPVYNMIPPPGEPALFGFNTLVYPIHLHTSVRPSDQGVDAEIRNLTGGAPLVASKFTLWGVPADPGHNALRGIFCEENKFGRTCAEPKLSTTEPLKPFLTLPMDCAVGPLETRALADSWQDLSSFQEASFLSHLTDGTPSGVTGCGHLPFDPGISLTAENPQADSPSGLAVDVHLPQTETPEGLAEATVKKVVVELPEGVTVNPGSANGLVGCTSEQANVGGPGGAKCPAESKLGTVEVDTPLLDHPLPGNIYIASQGDNPFNSLLAIYIAIDDPQTGITITLAGHVEPRASGQLVTTFDDNPQVPFTDIRVRLFGGARAALRMPSSCGIYTTAAHFVPWSAADPQSPALDEVVTTTDSFAINSGPNGGPCKTEGFQPTMEAGTANPVAGAFSPFLLKVKREDGDRELAALAVTPPEGLLGKIAGVPYCPEAAIATAVARNQEGEGSLELAAPSCPSSSKVGSVDVTVGAGPAPMTVRTGTAYLAGPYHGAPLSLVVIAPAVAGPFDLGAVVVRSALQIDPETLRLRAVSDDLPTVLHGIPLDLRSLEVTLDRSQFSLNPTSCEPMATNGLISGTAGVVASVSDRFQVGGCGELGFKPKLSFKLTGKTNRGAHPALRATLNMPKHGANIGRAVVALPHSEFLDQGHIKTICTRVQFAAEECPTGSVYGHARADTPLLDQPLEGPVYLRSSSHTLPDLVADLRGQIHVVLDGRIDSIKSGGIRTTFAQVPDAPVSKFTLSMQGGAKGLLINSQGLCAQTHRAIADFTGQNGKIHDFRPVLHTNCHK